MKKYITAAFIVLLFAGIFVNNATGTPAKKKKKAAAASVDSTAGAAATADTAKQKPAQVTTTTAENPPVLTSNGDNPTPDTSRFDANNLVADTTVLRMDDFTLDNEKPTDGFYNISTLRGAKPFAFPTQKVDNIKKYKRIWRQIDLTDSVNRIFAVPGNTLMSEIMNAIKTGKIIAYKDEEFTKQLTYEKAIGAFRDTGIANDIDSNGETVGTHQVVGEFNPDSVTKFEIKEDIYFDKVRGRVITEIISFGPVKKYKNSAGVYLFDQHPFYLYFKQCRKLFAAREVTDLQRDLSNVSYDDMFISRNFHSRIVKEASPSGLSIKDKFKTEEEQIRESNRIEQEIKNFKKGLFRF